MQMEVVMKRILVSIALATVSIFSVLLQVAPVSASPLMHAQIFADAKSDVCAGIGLTGGSCGGNASTQANTFLTTAINLLSVVVGVVAIVMIIIAGAKFITSNGDSGKIASAKTSIIYAIIGLVIVTLSQTIVHYVLTKSKV